MITFRKSILALACLPLFQSAAFASVASNAFYVSPGGSDSNSGNASAPFQTLTRAQQAARSSSTKTIYLRAGTYSLRSPITLTSADNDESWLAYPNETPVLDGAGSTEEAFQISSNNITIRWLKIQNFSLIGIQSNNSGKLFIDSNTILNIGSTGWNQGGIVLLNGIGDSVISHNYVAHSGYSGIMQANNPNIPRGLTRFEFNKIVDVCKSVSDCGALYSDDRGHNPVGVVMKNNVIDGFTSGSSSRGIYLDDEQSYAQVTQNVITGSGDYGIQIHGGDHNTIKDNILDVTNIGELGLYQWINSGTFPDYGMDANTFSCNLIVDQGTNGNAGWEDRTGGNHPMIAMNGNIYSSRNASRLARSTNDNSAVTANLNFVDAAAGNFTLISTAPQCASGTFQAPDLSAVGPVTNN